MGRQSLPLINIRPVRGLIATARRTRDLDAGGWSLPVAARLAAKPKEEWRIHSSPMEQKNGR